jgi:Ni,Fe-hydrogenase III small subunit
LKARERTGKSEDWILGLGYGTHRELLSVPQQRSPAELQERIQQVLGRSLAIREVDAGSSNGCEVEITALNNPIYDLERFGIHFVASPRHADMLLVTGPVTRNMEVALRKTYQATPQPRVVVAVGACGISGGISTGFCWPSGAWSRSSDFSRQQPQRPDIASIISGLLHRGLQDQGPVAQAWIG